MNEEDLGIIIGTIKSVDRVQGTSRLCIIKVDIGGKEVQIATGAPSDFEQGYLTGKQVPIKVDVQPIKVRGIESQARFLTILGSNKETILLVPENKVADGSKVW
jgi:tRNA-binding EMAP/Myf-like protein